jgi:metal-responsive CopG/Arc/MetJ family transcriptional regulator
VTLIQVNFQAEEDLIQKVDANCGGDGGRSEFIREAIREKLSRKKTEDTEFNSMIRQIKKMDPVDMNAKLHDVKVTTLLLYEEIKKQNEALKLIHRRINVKCFAVLHC